MVGSGEVGVDENTFDRLPLSQRFAGFEGDVHFYRVLA